MDVEIFKRMKVFANIVLALGLLGVFTMIFTLCFPEVSVGVYSTERQFSPSGFGTTIGSAIGVVSLYYILKGVAIIGIDRAHEISQAPIEPVRTISGSPEIGMTRTEARATNWGMPHRTYRDGDFDYWEYSTGKTLKFQGDRLIESLVSVDSILKGNLDKEKSVED